MRNCYTMVFVSVVLFLSGCATYSANHADINEQVDLYLRTLDDKHFVWCEIDLEQCQRDFENWRITPKGQVIIQEYKKETAGQTYKTHHLPNAFRAHFVDESSLVERDENTHSEGVTELPETLGPEVPSKY